jgi:hypothetical protein
MEGEGRFITLFDMVLLEWSCCTGGMRNHMMAIAAYEDGNKSPKCHAMTSEQVLVSSSLVISDVHSCSAKTMRQETDKHSCSQ